MSVEIPLKCRCGALRGTASEVSASTGSRVVCMCEDCQTFAHFLERAETVLDKNGGTDIFQLSPAQVRLVEGVEHLRCVRLSPKGLLRWYAGCCNTPVANTLPTAKVPFVGIPHAFMDHEGHGHSRETSLGPVRARIHSRFGIAPLPADAHPKAPVGTMGRAAWLMLGAWLRGRHNPSPFFKEGTPAVEATVLAKEERQSLRSKCGPQPTPASS